MAEHSGQLAPYSTMLHVLRNKPVKSSLIKLLTLESHIP
jgi:hypothetical protein